METISPELVRSVYLMVGGDLKEVLVVLLCGMGVMTDAAVPFPEGVVKLSIAERPSRLAVVALALEVEVDANLLLAAGVEAPVVVALAAFWVPRLAMGEGVTPAIFDDRLPNPVPLMTMELALLALEPPANFDKANRNPPKLASFKLSTFLVSECASHASTSSLGVRWRDSARLESLVNRPEGREGWPSW